jgi:hypothetical protein
VDAVAFDFDSLGIKVDENFAGACLALLHTLHGMMNRVADISKLAA